MIASYLATLPTSGKKPTTIADERYYGQLCQAIGHPYDTWVRLAILTGLRKSEQFGLRWADIDLDRGLITLPHTKSGTVQYVHLMEEAKAILRGLIPGNTSVWVFPSDDPETHLDHHNFYGRVYITALKDAKLEGVTWHTLRHTFASRLAMNGQGPSTIAALLRHSGTDLVARYAHLSPTHLHGALEGVSGFGKVMQVTTEAGPESRQEEQNAIPTVMGTGSAHEKREVESLQVAEGA